MREECFSKKEESGPIMALKTEEARQRVLHDARRCRSGSVGEVTTRVMSPRGSSWYSASVWAGGEVMVVWCC